MEKIYCEYNICIYYVTMGGRVAPPYYVHDKIHAAAAEAAAPAAAAAAALAAAPAADPWIHNIIFYSETYFS